MELKLGARAKSAVCDAEIVVIKPGPPGAAIQCGGHPVLAVTEEKPAGAQVDSAHAGGSQIGKRYIDAETGIEVLCAKAGAGSLSVNGRPMTAKETKALPASD